MTMHLEAPAALIVVDLQSATLASPFASPADDVVDVAAALVDAFHAHESVVVFAASTGTPRGQNAYGSEPRVFLPDHRVLAPALDVRESDVIVERAALSAFAGTDLAETLHDDGVTTVVVVGVATSFGVESTVRSAYDLGFHVVVASDAVTDLRAESNTHALTAVFPAIARVASSGDIVEALGRD
ncbi:isochorismatase family protein [Agromyces atrinae]|uniref:isochorismatase family protein n=1 Tax=Agromyces atrinae TaxID=592376 RepID=UPI001F59D861|nr:isochorismatase family protein [Agromyces atrinae]MCI2956865.1 isochorismatase family protein [Agromyces atrinae]